MDTKLQKEFQKEMQRKYELLAFECFLQAADGRTDVTFLEGRNKDAIERLEKDEALRDEVAKKLAEGKASGHGMPYKERKQLEDELRQHKDNIEGLHDLMHGRKNNAGQLIERGYDQYIAIAKSQVEEKKTQGEKNLKLAKLASIFTI